MHATLAADMVVERWLGAVLRHSPALAAWLTLPPLEQERHNRLYVYTVCTSEEVVHMHTHFYCT